MTDQAPIEPARNLIAFTPVARLKDRANGWKPEVQLAFIEALADTGSVDSACRAVGRTTTGAYQLRRHPEGAEFAAAWQAALAHGIQRIEDVAMDRALNGVEVPVYSYGKLVGTRTVYNDRLLMFMLRNRAPERFAGAEGPRALNAVGRMELERARKEWQAERDRAEAEAAGGMADFVEQIAAMHLKWWSRLGPRTRAAYVHFRRLERIEGCRWMEPGDAIEAELAAAEAEYTEVFAGDGRSRARLLGEVCGIGDEVTCPELDRPDNGETSEPTSDEEGREDPGCD
uniref:hypothetical protein n=1 Tax=Altererythrobacter segetis TaxID=1104773 RepID=UPI001407D0CB|nr:hypothetical protein [Altererythrobacter segetis]